MDLETSRSSRPANPKAKPDNKPDFGSIAGILLASAGILGGLILEGGRIKDILSITAAMIVTGGTVGAVLVSTPLSVVMRGVKRLVAVFFEHRQPLNAVIDEVIGYATKARKQGLVSLEAEADKIEDPFLRKALNLAVDGTDLQEIRKMLELEIEMEEHSAYAEAKVFEAAGGYSPTIGIIGAVMGLMQVMKNLANIDEVGHGIAVSFVATVYGVGIANLFLLPAANKIKARADAETRRKELLLDGVSGLVEGLNPKLLRLRLDSYARPGPGASAKPSDAKQSQNADLSGAQIEA